MDYWWTMLSVVGLLVVLAVSTVLFLSSGVPAKKKKGEEEEEEEEETGVVVDAVEWEHELKALPCDENGVPVWNEEVLARYRPQAPAEERALSGRVLLSICGEVFDVTEGGSFYVGKKGSYGVFAGRECCRALAMMSMEEKDVSGEVGDLTDKQVGIMVDWVAYYHRKYPCVGVIPELRKAAMERAPRLAEVPRGGGSEKKEQ